MAVDRDWDVWLVTHLVQGVAWQLRCILKAFGIRGLLVEQDQSKAKHVTLIIERSLGPYHHSREAVRDRRLLLAQHNPVQPGRCAT